MKIEGVKRPVSRFLSVEKDMGIVIERICQNERLKRLLYYNAPDALERPNLNNEQTIELFKRNIRMVPKMKIDSDILNYVIVRFDSFSPNPENPEFRDNTVEFDILCHFDSWMLKDYQLRPFKIAAEIDSMLDKTHLTGIGTLEFKACHQEVINDEIGGLCLEYKAIHGEEDKKFMANPLDEARFLEDFNQMIGNN